MTHEEAINKFVRAGQVNNELIIKAINEIYANFKSRTCNTCQFCYKPELTDNIYRCGNDVVAIEDGEITLDFGCINWTEK